MEVLQQTYDQHQGFNFFYFFLSSVILLLVSHIFNATYWTLLKHSKTSQVDMSKYSDFFYFNFLGPEHPILPSSFTYNSSNSPVLSPGRGQQLTSN